MNVLAFDTATDAIALALGRREGDAVTVVAQADQLARRAALSLLLPAVRELLGARGLAPGDIDAVVVGRGPGSFTGVRIGVASAKGLAHGLGVPLFGVSTLDAVAWGLVGTDRPARVSGLVGVVGDAMRGEVYPALFRASEGRVERLTPERVCRPDDAARDFAAAAHPVTLVGDGLAKYLDVFERQLHGRCAIAEEPLWRPSGAGVLAAFAAALVRGDEGDGDPAALLPVYTRLSDAEENERARAGAGAQVPPSGVGGNPDGGAS